MKRERISIARQPWLPFGLRLAAAVEPNCARRPHPRQTTSAARFAKSALHANAPCHPSRGSRGWPCSADARPCHRRGNRLQWICIERNKPNLFQAWVPLRTLKSIGGWQICNSTFPRTHPLPWLSTIPGLGDCRAPTRQYLLFVPTA